MKDEIDYVDVANKKSAEAFLEDYLPPSKEWRSWTHPQTKDEYEVTLHKASSLSPENFQDCFNLIELTSSEDYKKSEGGWKPKAKKKEMRLLDLKYLLVKREDAVEAFLSFMPTYEDDYPVVYCYEIHLAPSLQSTGLGKRLMGLLEVVAKRIPDIDKVMLTVFVINDRAVQFYQKLGFGKDEYSPPARQLRDGTRIESKYIILSKAVG